MESLVNVNCGVLGHVDSGKTSLCRSLHHTASTASMDKNPQSQERGITLDLGFSAFVIPGSPGRHLPLQVTLVDCPGHATLMRTVLAGAQIMDVCLLVIDSQKGFQAQTAECLIIAEILCAKLCIVVNKLDLIPQESISRYKETFLANARRLLSKTRFGMEVPINFVSAHSREGLAEFINSISAVIGSISERDPSGPLHLSYDHCFSVKGQGTVFTGTVLSGSLRRGQKVLIPSFNQIGEIRMIQKFHRLADSAVQGDRVGVCLPGVSPEGKERGDIYDLDFKLENSNIIVALVRRIKYFKLGLGDSKFHIMIGHQHVTATPLFFRARDIRSHRQSQASPMPVPPVSTSLHAGSLISELNEVWPSAIELLADLQMQFEAITDMTTYESATDEPLFCILPLPRRVKYPHNALFVAAKLDLDVEYPGCRLAFYGRVLPQHHNSLKDRIIKLKTREGIIDRRQSDRTFLVRGLLKKQCGDPSRYIGQSVVHVNSSVRGCIESTFGKSGLLKVQFTEAIPGDPSGDSVQITQTKSAFVKILEGYDVF